MFYEDKWFKEKNQQKIIYEKSLLGKLATQNFLRPLLQKIVPYSHFKSNELNKQPELKSHQSMQQKINYRS